MCAGHAFYFIHFLCNRPTNKKKEMAMKPQRKSKTTAAKRVLLLSVHVEWKPEAPLCYAFPIRTLTRIAPGWKQHLQPDSHGERNVWMRFSWERDEDRLFWQRLFKNEQIIAPYAIDASKHYPYDRKDLAIVHEIQWSEDDDDNDD